MDLNKILGEDLCQNQNLTVQTIIESLSQRYTSNKIFTFIGPILLAINPYREIKQLFNEEILQKVVNDTLEGKLKNIPHIYVIAAKAFLAMNEENRIQSIIISGESGAGKTESAKYCMKTIANLTNKQDHTLSEKILACNPLLEAFGNSKTIKNENSSRFGKFTQIFFDKDRSIKGAKIQTYLLEKSRVSLVEKGERNFHIFYALTASGFLGARSAKEYAYLNRSQCYIAQGINDRQFFKQVNHSLELIGYKQIDRVTIWRLLLAILQIGNLQFDDKKFNQDENNNTCEIIANQDSYAFIIQALNTTKIGFQTVILKINKGKYKNNAKKEDCIKNRDAFAKIIYSFCFQEIIDKIQVELKYSKQNNFEPTAYHFNLLDIFGFENLQKNSLQQICINFTNQKLLAQYNQKIFQNQINILREDGLQGKVSEVVMPSNRVVVQLIVEMFKIMNQCTTNAFYKEQNMITRIGELKNPNNIPYPNTKLFFKIRHSPCQVEYSISGFKVKNQDQITSQMAEICKKIFHCEQMNHKSRTIINKFTEQMNQLINRLKESSNHFVRCIKPNQLKKANQVQTKYFRTQITYLGVLQTVKIRQAVFPCRKTYEKFAQRYRQVFRETHGKTDQEATKIIVDKMDSSNKQFLYGNVRVYMKIQLEQKLEKQYKIYMDKKVQKIRFIQKQYRKIRHIRLFREFVLEQIRKNRELKIKQKSMRIQREQQQLLQQREDDRFEKSKIIQLEQKYQYLENIIVKDKRKKSRIQHFLGQQRQNQAKTQYVELKCSYQQLQKQRADLIQRLAAKDIQIQQENQKCQSLSQQLNAMKDSMLQLQERLRNAEAYKVSNKHKLQQKNKDYQIKLIQMKAELQNNSRILKEANKNYQAELIKLKKEILKLSQRNTQHATEKANLQKKITSLAKQNNELYDQIDFVNANLDQMNKLNVSNQMRQQSHEFQYLTSKISQLLEQNQELKDQMRQLNRKVKDGQQKAKIISQTLFDGKLRQVIQSLINKKFD